MADGLSDDCVSLDDIADMPEAMKLNLEEAGEGVCLSPGVNVLLFRMGVPSVDTDVGSSLGTALSTLRMPKGDNKLSPATPSSCPLRDDTSETLFFFFPSPV